MKNAGIDRFDGAGGFSRNGLTLIGDLIMGEGMPVSACRASKAGAWRINAERRCGFHTARSLQFRSTRETCNEMDQPVFPVCGDDAEAISGYEQRLFRLEFSNLILGDEDNSRKHLNQEVRFFVYFPDMTSVFQSKSPDFHFPENVPERWPKQTAIREKWKFSAVRKNGS